MGNQNSSEKPSGARSGTPQDRDKDKKVNRRQSVQALHVSHRGAPADPAASTASALAQTSSRPLEPSELQQHLQGSPSPDPYLKTERSNRVGRSVSRKKKAEDGLSKPKPSPAPPVAVPQPSIPMNVPIAKSKQESLDKKAFAHDYDDRPEPSPYDDRRYVPPSQLRPQRLPLPIVGAPEPPESPTLGPVDRGNQDVPLFEDDEPLTTTEHHLRRRSSIVSNANQEDEEDEDEELPPPDPDAGTVSTVIEWNHSGNKVFVTGTFVNWEKKFKLHHRKDGRKGLCATIALTPGTHHLIFLVDEVMMTNPELPTAVDFNNVLVNYIEVAHEDLIKTRRESNQTDKEKRDPAYPGPQQQPSVPEQPDDEDEVEIPLEDAELLAEEILPGDFRQIVPQALQDIDLPEDDPRYQQAARVIGDCNGPPTLPLFLSKSILNGILPNKDDSSVLGLPNHTVLNHLMTSSVKNGVLATSATTRYKKKYVTTISFKPVPKAKAASSQ